MDDFEQAVRLMYDASSGGDTKVRVIDARINQCVVIELLFFVCSVCLHSSTQSNPAFDIAFQDRAFQYIESLKQSPEAAWFCAERFFTDAYADQTTRFACLQVLIYSG